MAMARTQQNTEHFVASVMCLALYRLLLFWSLQQKVEVQNS